MEARAVVPAGAVEAGLVVPEVVVVVEVPVDEGVVDEAIVFTLMIQCWLLVLLQPAPWISNVITPVFPLRTLARSIFHGFFRPVGCERTLPAWLNFAMLRL